LRLEGDGAGDAEALLLSTGKSEGGLLETVFDFIPEGGGLQGFFDGLVENGFIILAPVRRP